MVDGDGARLSFLKKVGAEILAPQFIPSLGGFANRHMDAAPGENVKTSNWTLYSLSVHPDHQGKGISRLLVKAGEDQVNKNTHK